MKKTSLFGITLALLLALSALAGLIAANYASANPDIFNRQYLPAIAIRSDGSITQDAAFISQAGNTYTLNADVDSYSVEIQCSNIVFDGAGHSINASAGFENAGLRLIGVTNVTVTNLKVMGDYSTNIFLSGTNCTVKNVKTEGELHLNYGNFINVIQSDAGKISLLHSENNFISKCTILRLYLVYSNSNLFTQNSFLFDFNTDNFRMFDSTNLWDDGLVGNYWSDYTERYPGASEIRHTGVGDTPYVLGNGNVDHYPIIMHPFDFGKDQTTLPEQEPARELANSQTFTTIIVVGISAATIVGAVAGSVYHQKKKNR